MELEHKQPKVRLGWLAALLALLSPGLGHLYAGRRGLAACLMLVPVGIGVAGVGVAFSTFPGLIAIILAFLVFYLGSASHAWTSARHAGVLNRSLAPRWYEYVFFLAAITVMSLVFRDFIAGPIANSPTGERYRPFSAASQSMTPNLLPGDHFMMALSPRPPAPTRGQVVAYRKPGGMTTHVHRVVAVAGDSVELVSGRLKINGVEVVSRQLCNSIASDAADPADELIEERAPQGAAYVVLHSAAGAGGQDLPSMIVPEGEFIVLGDYRANAADSRVVGAIPVENIVGVPLYIYWSQDWSRFGQSLSTSASSGEERRLCATKYQLF